MSLEDFLARYTETFDGRREETYNSHVTADELARFNLNARANMQEDLAAARKCAAAAITPAPTFF